MQYDLIGLYTIDLLVDGNHLILNFKINNGVIQILQCKKWNWAWVKDNLL